LTIYLTVILTIVIVYLFITS